MTESDDGAVVWLRGDDPGRPHAVLRVIQRLLDGAADLERVYAMTLNIGRPERPHLRLVVHQSEA